MFFKKFVEISVTEWKCTQETTVVSKYWRNELSIGRWEKSVDFPEFSSGLYVRFYAMELLIAFVSGAVVWDWVWHMWGWPWIPDLLSHPSKCFY